MKTIILYPIQKAFIIACFFLCFIGKTNAQTFTNNINISSSNQGTVPGSYNTWLVTNESAGMMANTCIAGQPVILNGCPPQTVINGATLPIVGLNQPAFNVGVSAGYTNLSCFNSSVIYTRWPSVPGTNFTNSTMIISRSFMVCSNNTEQVTFNFTIRCDDGVNSVLLDGNPATPLFTGAVPTAAINPITVGITLPVTPGLHTIDIQCYDWENPNGCPVTVNGVIRQWNPFIIGINGTISTAINNNVLLNAPVPSVDPITGPTTLCAGATITLSDATPGGTWTSSDPTVATIDQAGLVTGVNPGNATISYTITNGQCTNVATLPITVTICHCEDSCNWSLTGNSNVRS